jgi:hypothetical protein
MANETKMTNKEFMKKCENAAYGVLTCWASYINCCMVGGKKQFNLCASHNWGTAHCDWSAYKWELFNALKMVGAVNISGKVKWNYVDVYFDMSKRL